MTLSVYQADFSFLGGLCSRFIDSCAKVEHQLSSLGVSWPDWIRFQSLSGMFIDHDMPACGDWNRRVEVQIRCTSTDWFFLSGSKARVLDQGLWITSRRNISKFCQRQTLNTLQQRKYGWMSRSTTNIGDMCVGQRYKNDLRWLHCWLDNWQELYLVVDQEN